MALYQVDMPSVHPILPTTLTLAVTVILILIEISLTSHTLAQVEQLPRLVLLIAVVIHSLLCNMEMNVGVVIIMEVWVLQVTVICLVWVI